MRQRQGRLEELARKSDTSSKLLYESQVTAPDFVARRAGAGRAKPVFKIHRMVGGFASEIDATEATPVLAGDTIKVEMPLPEPPTAIRIPPLSSAARGAETVSP